MKKLFICLTLFTFHFSLFTYSQMKQGEIAIGGTSSDQANSIVQTKDGGYAVTGYSESFGPGYYNVYVMKFDSNGRMHWNRIIGGSSLQQGLSIVQSDDGGYAVTGYTASFGLSHATVYVLKLDASGSIQWTRTIGGPLSGSGAEWGYSIIQTYDKGYAIGGYTTSYGAGQGDFYIIKLDSVGNLKWTRTVGSSADEEAYTIIQCSDHGFALAGYTNPGNANVFVVKLDHNSATVLRNM